MIDIHCHLLPGIDDGPETLEESLELARALAAEGVTHVVVTPHIHPGRYDNTRAGIAAELQRFEQALQTFRIPLELRMAAEVRLSVEVLELLERDEIPFLGRCDGGSTMLLEFPDTGIPVGSDRLARHLVDRGIWPVIVHPERNQAVVEKPERIRPFVDMGCRLQLTASSVVGVFGRRAEKTARHLLEQGWVSAVASDAHSLRFRPPRMREAHEHLSRSYGAQGADELMRHGPARLIGAALSA